MQLFAMQFWRLTAALKFPREYRRMVLVVAECFTIRRLIFLAEMCAGGFVTLQGVNAHQLGEFEEIRHTPGAFQCLVVIFFVSRYTHVAPEFCTQFGNLSERFEQSLFVTRHSAFVPQKKPKFTMERIG